MLLKDLRKITAWGLAISMAVYMVGWLVNIADGEPAYYAAASLEMIRKGEYFHFIDFDHSHSGTAPLAFWLSHFSMSILGTNNIASRIPSLLLTLVTLHSVYRFAKLHYSPEVYTLAVLITATLQATFILNAQTDTITGLMAFYTYTIWQLSEYYRFRKLQNLTLGVLGAILAILSTSSANHPPAGAGPIQIGLVSLCTFAPWTIFFLLGFVEKGKEIIQHWKTGIGLKEWISLFGLFVPLFLFLFNPSSSVHDLFVIFPMAAILTAEYIIKITYTDKPAWFSKLYFLQIFLSYLWLSILFGLVWFPFQDNNYFGLIHFLALLGLFSYLIFFSWLKNKLIISCMILATGSNLVLTSYFYPNMMRYQAGSELGIVARNNNVQEGKLFTFRTPTSHALHFYSGVRPVQATSLAELASSKNSLVYTTEDMISGLREVRPDLRIIATSPDFTGQDLNLRFLDPLTRDQTVSKKVLLGL